jgi:hypothetical protein
MSLFVNHKVKKERRIIMKRKLTFIGVCLVAVAALTAVYIAGWLRDRPDRGRLW